jgi:hypothetical protein
MYRGAIASRDSSEEDQANANHAIQAPEIQTMYSLNMPVSRIRTRMRQEFERHRYVDQLPTVDVLISQSNMEFQVRRVDVQKTNR